MATGYHDALDRPEPRWLCTELLSTHLRRHRIRPGPHPLRQAWQDAWRSLPLHRSFPVYWTNPGTGRRAPILWAWLPVTVAFLIRFATWKSQTSSVFDTHRSVGRIERFFGPLYGQTSGLLDSRWITDRFLFTGPMLFLIACALAALLRYKLTAPRKPQVEKETGSGPI
ncbi:hypothetical protein RBB78_07760 [Tunturiibacter empetritectus]|uniref:hypothetical protein n=1 Tax=Tunturiibacter empetritectus TaxID=3069691 RepID=UPI003D9B14B1